jgi:hypothetical protein
MRCPTAALENNGHKIQVGADGEIEINGTSQSLAITHWRSS